MAERNAPPGIQQSRRATVDELGRVRARTAHARRIRDDWQTKYRLDDLYNHFLGDDFHEMSRAYEDDDFLINKFWPTIKTLLPSLFLQNPTFIIRSKNESKDPSSLLKAKMAESVLSAIAQQEFHLEFSVKLALLQAFFSIGALKSCYEPKLLPNPRKGEPKWVTDGEGFPQLDEFGALQPLLDEDGQQMIEPDKIVDDETYRWEWVNGDKMLLPDAGPNHLRWPWVAEEVTVLLDEAREDERFPRNLRSQLQSNSSLLDNRLHVSSFGQLDASEDEYITYIEYWDIRKRRHMILVEGQTFSETRFLLSEDYRPGIEEHPYSLLLGFTPIIAPKPSPWPLPHTWNWLGLQKEYNIRRKQMMIGAKRTARKIYYDEATFPDAEQAVAALQSAEDMQGVKVSSIERIPIAQQDAPLPPNIAQDVTFIDSDWNRTTGVSSARSGGSRGSNTATAEKIEFASGEARDIEMRHAVNVWLTDCGRKMLQLVRATLTIGMHAKLRGTNDSLYQNYIARAYGPEFVQRIAEFPNLRASFDAQFGEDRWQYVSREELEFEFDLSVAPGSARPRNREAEKEDFFEFIKVMSLAPQLTQSRALLTRAADMFEFIDESMVDEILAAAAKANQIEQMKAGRLQGNASPAQQNVAAQGGGANVSAFRQQFIGA